MRVETETPAELAHINLEVAVVVLADSALMQLTVKAELVELALVPTSREAHCCWAAAVAVALDMTPEAPVAVRPAVATVATVATEYQAPQIQAAAVVVLENSPDQIQEVQAARE